MTTYGEVGEQQRRWLVIGRVDDDVDGGGGGAIEPVAHSDGHLVHGWLRPSVLGLNVVDETRGQVGEAERFWEKELWSGGCWNTGTRTRESGSGSEPDPDRHLHTDQSVFLRCSSPSPASAARPPGSRRGAESPGERSAPGGGCLGPRPQEPPHTDRPWSLHSPAVGTPLETQRLTGRMRPEPEPEQMFLMNTRTRHDDLGLRWSLKHAAFMF